MKIETCTENSIQFNNGFTLEYDHAQDCCEHVYADFGHLKNYNILPHTGQPITIGDIEFDEDIENKIEGIQDEGFNLIAKDGSKWFVPCHNAQNGYYSSELSLVIKKSKKITVTIDISDFVKDEIS